MMNKLIILGIVALLIGCNTLKKDEFVIRGNITSYPADVLILAYQTNGDFILDTVRVTDGKLDYRKQVTEPIVASLVSRDMNSNIALDRGVIPGPNITLFIEPGTALQIDMDNRRWPEVRMKGGPLNNDLMRLYEKTLPLEHDAFEALRKSYVKDVPEEEKTALQERQSELKGKAREALTSFVKNNPSSYVAMYLLGGIRNDMTLEEYADVFYSFDQNVRDTPLGQEMNAAIELARKTAVGSAAPDFEKVDKDGKTIRLSDYKGKYVLLDFWGTWCSPCRASHPHLREIEAKYGPRGLVVINIAQEGNKNARETWLKAIAEDKMTWTQILNDEGIEKCDVVKLFSITAFPTKVLLDSQGKIAVRAVGESEPIDAKLKEVYGE